ncbi:MAG: hypothetical protein ACI8ZO_000281 [Flavobacteriales bacterium]|jgi:hypothetical protein
MRPLKRSKLLKQAFSFNAHDLLMDHHGTYCSISEEPLPDHSLVINSLTGEEVKEKIASKDWPKLLLISAATAQAMKGKDPKLLKKMILPHQYDSFSIDDDSPFIYELKMVAISKLDDDGNIVEGPQAQAKVIVSATTPEAQATIDFFELNTKYYNAEKNHIEYILSEYNARHDHRVEHRTAAWMRATHAIETHLKAKRMGMDTTHLIPFLRNFVDSTGYWSCWASVIWKLTNSSLLLKQIMQQPSESPAVIKRANLEENALLESKSRKQSKMIHEFIGSGPHHIFPGTQNTWLPKTKI